MGDILIREFINNAGDKYIVREISEGNMVIDFVPFSLRVTDWSFIDEEKAKGRLRFVKMYETRGI